jgi:hypothetical protein
MADQPTDADRFEAMAKRIRHNADQKFGGAAVIIPPVVVGNEKPIELLMLDTGGDPAQFIATLVTRLQMMAREIEDNQRRQGGFGGR